MKKSIIYFKINKNYKINSPLLFKTKNTNILNLFEKQPLIIKKNFEKNIILFIKLQQTLKTLSFVNFPSFFYIFLNTCLQYNFFKNKVIFYILKNLYFLKIYFFTLFEKLTKIKNQINCSYIHFYKFLFNNNLRIKNQKLLKSIFLKKCLQNTKYKFKLKFKFMYLDQIKSKIITKKNLNIFKGKTYNKNIKTLKFFKPKLSKKFNTHPQWFLFFQNKEYQIVARVKKKKIAIQSKNFFFISLNTWQKGRISNFNILKTRFTASEQKFLNYPEFYFLLFKTTLWNKIYKESANIPYYEFLNLKLTKDIKNSSLMFFYLCLRLWKIKPIKLVQFKKTLYNFTFLTQLNSILKKHEN